MRTIQAIISHFLEMQRGQTTIATTQGIAERKSHVALRLAASQTRAHAGGRIQAAIRNAVNLVYPSLVRQ